MAMKRTTNTRSSLRDLNEYLFEALDRLSNDDLKEEDLDREVNRAEAMTKIAHTVIDAADLQYKAFKLAKEYGANTEFPHLLGVKTDA